MDCLSPFLRNRNAVYRAIIVSLIAFVACGCAAPRVIMYSGGELPANQQATIRGDDDAGRHLHVRIARVDDERTVGFFAYFADGWAREVSVLPGKHRLVIKMHIGSSHAWGNLWLVADPGETYIVKARTEGYSTKMWLENERTGQKVGGVVGGGNEPK